jgi:3-phytase
MKKNSLLILLFIRLLLFLEISYGVEKTKIEFDVKQKITMSHKLKYKNTFLGGLSGLKYEGNSLFAVSDDRGRFGPPRIYEFKILKNKSDFNLKVESVLPLTKKNKLKSFQLLDLEGLEFHQGKWLLSSEGNLHSKPRVIPDILSFAPESSANRDGLKPNWLKIPDEFLPNSTGVLNKGLKNNMAFEGMTKDSSKLYLLSESNLLQDKAEVENVSSYLLSYSLESKELIQKQKIYFDTGAKFFLYFGASELTFWKEKKFFILTRGVALSAELSYECQLWLLDLDNKNQMETDVIQPTLLLDLKAEKMDQNYEGLALYKDVQEEYLIIVSDDNFNKLEKTEFIFLRMK